ncbi:MAG: c-type cytochrome [Parasphingorhabdus sp.]|nr:c-type cytochrome [Parasphingorhabdus sp.]
MAAAFKVHCVQCHGSGAAGFKGYPNLNDDDWLWGGDISAIRLHAARTASAIRMTTRHALVGDAGLWRDELLTPEEIADVVQHVRNLSRQGKAQRRCVATLFADNCAVLPWGRG